MWWQAIQAFFIALGNCFSFAEKKTELQCETDVLKTKKKLEKKTDKSNDLILDMADLIKKYKGNMKVKDKVKANACLRKIKKVN